MPWSQKATLPLSCLPDFMKEKLTTFTFYIFYINQRLFWSSLINTNESNLMIHLLLHKPNFMVYKILSTTTASSIVLYKAEEPEIKLPTSAGSSKNQESSRKTSISALLTMPKLWLCGSQERVENSERDGNTRPPDLPLEKPICRSGNNS